MCHTRISQPGRFWSLGDTWQCLKTVLFSHLVEQKFFKVLLASSEEGPGMLPNLLECTKRSMGPWCPSWDPMCYRIQTASVSTTLPIIRVSHSTHPAPQDLSPPLSQEPLLALWLPVLFIPLPSRLAYLRQGLQIDDFKGFSSAMLLGSCLPAEPTDEVVRAAGLPASNPEPRQQQGRWQMLNSCCWQRSTAVARPTDATARAKAALANVSSWSNLQPGQRSLLCVGSGHRETQSSFLILCWLITLDDWLRSLFLIPLLWLILINSPDLWNAMGDELMWQ